MLEQQTLSIFSMLGSRWVMLGSCWNNKLCHNLHLVKCWDHVVVCQDYVGATNFVKLFNVGITLGYGGIMLEQQTLSTFSLSKMLGLRRGMSG